MPTSTTYNRHKERREKKSSKGGFCDEEDELADAFDDFHFAKEDLEAHDGHTIRRTMNYDKALTNPVLSRRGGFSALDSATYGLLPVTEVDFFFDRGYVEANNSHSRVRPIRDALQTSEIVATLERLAVQKNTEFNKNGVYETMFDIPVCGHYLPITLNQLQEANGSDARIFAGEQRCITNETKRSRSKFGSNKRVEEWRLHGGASTKEKSNSANTEGMLDKTRWLYYQGKYWDPSMLYVFKPTIDDHCETQTRSVGTLQKLCPLQETKAFHARIQLGPVSVDSDTKPSTKKLTAAMVRKQFEQLQKEADDTGSERLNRLMVKAYTDKSAPRGEYARFFANGNNKTGGGNRRHSQNSHLEIDLGEVCDLTHIGFLGGYPHHADITTFPPTVQKLQHDYGVKGQRWLQRGMATKGRGRRRGRGRQKKVYIVRENAIGYVTRFAVQYRDQHTHKWRTLPHELPGNSDIVHEERHKVSFQTNCIRVIPRDYHNNRDFFVLLYGQTAQAKVTQAWEERCERKVCKRARDRYGAVGPHRTIPDDEEIVYDSDYMERLEQQKAEEAALRQEDEDSVDDEEWDDWMDHGDQATTRETRPAATAARHTHTMKKPLNMSDAYDAVVHRQAEDSNEAHRQQELQKASRWVHQATHTKYQRRVITNALLGKKVETITYTLSYHAHDAYDADQILDQSDASWSDTLSNDDHIDAAASGTSKKRQHWAKRYGGRPCGQYMRLPEGRGCGFYNDYYYNHGPSMREKQREMRQCLTDV
eukprot:gene7308-5255_t